MYEIGDGVIDGYRRDLGDSLVHTISFTPPTTQ